MLTGTTSPRNEARPARDRWAQQGVPARGGLALTYLLPRCPASRTTCFADRRPRLRRLSTRLEDAARGRTMRHDVFGTRRHRRARAQLGPGDRPPRRAAGGGYARDEIARCPRRRSTSSPPPYRTQGRATCIARSSWRGRSHPERGRRALRLCEDRPDDGRDVFLLATPRGRVVLKEAAAIRRRSARLRIHAEHDPRRRRRPRRGVGEAPHRPREADVDEGAASGHRPPD